MGLSDVHEEYFKLYAMEYNNIDNQPANDLGNYVNTLHHHNKDNEK
jgi:hypothetical protein